MKSRTKPVLLTLLALLVEIAVTIALCVAVSGPAQAAGSVTMHNNYHSDRVVTTRDGNGNLHYIGLGQTVSEVVAVRIYVATGTCIRYGDPVSGMALGKVCASDYGPTSWAASKSLWLDVVPN
jgi:hypothetical protein